MASARPMTLTFRYYGDVMVTNWRWTLRSSNGQIVAASTESYRRRLDAVRNAALVLGLDVEELAAEVAAVSVESRGRLFSRACGPLVRVVVR